MHSLPALNIGPNGHGADDQSFPMSYLSGRSLIYMYTASYEITLTTLTDEIHAGNSSNNVTSSIIFYS